MNSIFLVKIPSELKNINSNDYENMMIPKENLEEKAEVFDWEFAQRELMAKVDKIKKNQEEMQEKARQEEENYKKEKIDTEVQMKNQEEEFQLKIKMLEEKMQQESERQKLEIEKKEAERILKENIAKIETERTQRELERERQKKQLQNEEMLKRFKARERQYLENKLAKYLPKILEVNLIAKELKRNIQFNVKLAYFYAEANEIQTGEDKHRKQKINIEVINKEDGQIYIWSLRKFLNRYYIIKDVLDRYFETYSVPALSKEEDPFWDPPEQQLIGLGYVTLVPLLYLIDNPTEINLVNDSSVCGNLTVDVIPVDETGTKNLSDVIENDENPDVDIIEDPREMIGRRLDIMVLIESEYSLLNEHNVRKTYRTPVLEGRNSNPLFNYSLQHTIDCVNELILCFKVYGFRDFDPNIMDEQSANALELGKNMNNINPDNID